MGIESLRPASSGFRAVAGVASGAIFAAVGQAHAQESTPSAPVSAVDDPANRLAPVTVKGKRDPSNNALQTGTGLDRLPDTLQSTPQSVTVIPQVVIEQQQATTVDQVLKYVPGVTVSTGEGNGGMNGDAFRIRGFDAKGDIYIDGLRDFGAYVRDDFATENVQVFKGSSSESFGNGTTGGAINLEQKKAHLGNASSVQGTLGNGSEKRTVVDVNRQIGATTAARLVGMWTDQNIVDRDHVYSRRWGVLGSLGFGLGTDQTFTITYMHQHGNRRPDMGVPIPSRTDGGVGYPVTEDGVPRSNFFGKETDRDVTNVDMVTLRYRKEIGDWLTLSNDTRYAHYTRRMVFTPSVCEDGGGYLGIPLTTCASSVLAGNLNTAYTVWPVIGDTQTSSGGENLSTAVARFHTGALRQELAAGLDVYYQRNVFGLVALTTGVIAHRRLFAEFFAFRWRSGARSWRDAHTTFAVLALPFHLMISYTGVTMLVFFLMPWATFAHYPSRQAFLSELMSRSRPAMPSGHAAPLVPLDSVLKRAEAIWNGGSAETIRISNPGDRAATIQVDRLARDVVRRAASSLTFNGVTGALIHASPSPSDAASAAAAVFDLHEAHFARPALRWLLFLCGATGTAMVATGLVLWTAKRRRNLLNPDYDRRGFQLVETLNIAVIAGYPAATVAYFWANRLLPFTLASRANAEVLCAFGCWGALLIWSALRPKRNAWIEALSVAALLFLALPIVNAATTSRGTLGDLLQGDTLYLAFDGVTVTLGLIFAAAAFWVGRRRGEPVSSAERMRRSDTPGLPLSGGSE